MTIEIEGEPPQLDQFLADLVARPPPLARIEEVAWESRSPRGDAEFQIAPSVNDQQGHIAISPDVATCEDCLAELFDPRNRRYRYPFLNCTHCGPRLTIVTGSPYDRERTTMAAFELCAACRAEYKNPRDRRFHAQPTACPDCGPHLAAMDSRGGSLEIADPLAWFIDALRAGRIGAMKGLGGYHLACDAHSETAVSVLRQRKHREEKPFAVMVADLEMAHALCEIGAEEAALLASARRPIVLLRKKPGIDLPKSVAPGNPMLGLMLPYTPLHHLLMRDIGSPLIMTSGNRADEPIATTEPAAFECLAGIADVFLTHNRPIHVRCDDSVTRIIGNTEAPIRRSRGVAPQPIRLPISCRAPILAVGAQLKNTFALGHHRQAVVSHHLGDLDHFEAYRAFEKDIVLYEQLYSMHPRYIAHDLHPDYATTRYARKRAAAEGIELIPIPHHHAHLASCMAEHDIDEPVIGVSFDGTGYGTDGAVWGGEFFHGNFGDFIRAAHLRYVPMPGGERAVKEPWRMAVAHLLDAGVECPSLWERLNPLELRTVKQMIQHRFNSPMTSSIGRLFDAVAAILGVRDRVSFEGQAAMQLEALAASCETNDVYPFKLDGEMIDSRPLIRAIAIDLLADAPSALTARRFHNTVIEMIAQTCARIGRDTGLRTIVMSGGVFANVLIRHGAERNLSNNGFLVLSPSSVPANDGGISLGQLAIAARLTGATACA